MRHLNLLEYQSKSLLEKYNVTVQKFIVADKIEDTNSLSKLSKLVKYCHELLQICNIPFRSWGVCCQSTNIGWRTWFRCV